jgi:hypothetical protein
MSDEIHSVQNDIGVFELVSLSLGKEEFHVAPFSVH